MTVLASRLAAALPKNKSEIYGLISQPSLGVSISSKFQQILDNFHKGSFNDCYALCDILLDRLWEKLNIGNWKDVSSAFREAYSLATVFKIVSFFRLKNEICVNDVHEGIRICDMGLLMGAPVLDNILHKVIEILQSELHESSDFTTTGRILKRKSYSSVSVAKIPTLNERNLIERVSCPSLETFRTEFLERNKPVILTDCISHWPAMKRWSIAYIKRIAGPRTVPIELGSRYTDQNWSQTLMTISEFIDRYILDGDKVGYLAQHQLFDQIPDLERDVIIPDYCCLGDEVDINAWFGPGGTISPLHYDPKQNFLAQVMGEKYVRLYDESMSSFLYPHSDKLLFNTSQVDVENPDFELFPDFEKAEFCECVLKPGEVLYIPPRCWHYVRSLSVSFSVSFWWKYCVDGAGDQNDESAVIP